MKPRKPIAWRARQSVAAPKFEGWQAAKRLWVGMQSHGLEAVVPIRACCLQREPLKVTVVTDGPNGRQVLATHTIAGSVRTAL
jgi:hypothetical protein